MIQKKKHHYVPVTYLNGFTDAGGRVFAYRKDEPDAALHVLPSEIAFERYYYSQPLPEGGQDNNTLEDFFGTIESPWPQIVGRFERAAETDDDFLKLLTFLGLMRVRGPCMRDAIELQRAEFVKMHVRALDRDGLLPPKPLGFEDILDHLEVPIDPHVSLHAIPGLLQGFSRVLDALTFEILHNRAGVDFLTSDNPVAVFDPSIAETAMQPYQLRRELNSAELLFPISSKLMLRGLARRYQNAKLSHSAVTSIQDVKRMNRICSKFGYRFVFANSEAHARVIQKHATISPVPRFEASPPGAATSTFVSSTFGTRPKKPRWTGANSGEKSSG